MSWRAVLVSLLVPVAGSLGQSCAMPRGGPAAVDTAGGNSAPDAPVRYLRFRSGERTAYGIVDGDEVHEIAGDLFGDRERTGRTYALDEVEVLVPTEPSKVVALAGNYRDHLGDTPVPEHPEPFFKLPSCLIPHGGQIVQPATTEKVHYEAELVVVVGERMEDVPEEAVLDHVFGVTCGNDVSARVWQENDVQWWRAKATDTFGPCGPYVARGLDYGDLDIELRLNGEVRQASHTGNMIHGIPEALSFISHHVTLEPGDLVFLGTPGETQGMDPGDTVEVEIEGVGVLENRVVAGDGS